MFRVPLEKAKRMSAAIDIDDAPKPDIDAAIERLAAMTEVDYARARKGEAKRLDITPIAVLDNAVKALRSENGDGKTKQGRDIVLPEAEPWPEDVDGGELLDQMVAAFNHHLALPDGAAEAMSIWCLHTYCTDAFQNTPRLALTSPEKRCGKTTALTLASALVWRPLSASNITAAAVFRTIESAQPTLILDEADTFIRDSDDLRGILNSGHSRATGFVIRTTGDDHEPRQFSTWGAVAIAAIGALPETLEDRAIMIPMRRRTATESVARLRSDRLHVFQPLCQQARRWADDNIAYLQNADPETPGKLHDRAADNWRPLLAIADRAGGAWPERARQTAITLLAAGDDTSIKTQLLADICDIIGDREKIKSVDLVAALTEKEDRPWGEWRRGSPLSAIQLARLLKPFNVAPKPLRFETERQTKGYTRDSFRDAFARYIPGQNTREAPFPESDRLSGNKSQNSAGYSENRAVTDSEACYRSELPETPVKPPFVTAQPVEYPEKADMHVLATERATSCAICGQPGAESTDGATWFHLACGEAAG